MAVGVIVAGALVVVGVTVGGITVGPAVGVPTATLFETVIQVGKETNGDGTPLNRLSLTATFVPCPVGKLGAYQRGPPHFSIRLRSTKTSWNWNPHPL